MLGFGGHIKKENRIPKFSGGPHGSSYAPHPYSPTANPAPGHSPPATSNLAGGAEPTGRYGPLGGNFGPAPQGLPDLSNLRGGGGFRRGGGVGTVAYGEQQRKDALNDPRWRAGILARQDKLKKNPWQQPTGGGMRNRGAFNNYMQNLRQPMY